MAYQPEIMRPELQRANGNRNGLNIEQPGEDNWKENFGLSPEDYVDRSKSFGLGDVLPSVSVGAAQSVQGTGELARGLGDGLINSPVKTAARIESELLKLWSPGVSTINDIIPGAGKSVEETIDALPDGKNAVTDTIGKGLKVTGKGVSDVAGATKDWSYDKMSPGAQRALNTPMSEGWDDSAVWVAKGTNLIGSLLPDLAAGGLTKKVGEVALKKALTSGLEKKFIASGLAPEKAGILAAKAVEEKMPDLFQAGMMTSSTASAQGSTAMNAAQSILNADYSELSKSPKFQEAFYAIDDDPQYAELSDRQKMDMAKERVADEVRTQLATDPQSLIVNALAAKLGDAQLVNLALRGTAKSVTSGIAHNMAEQAGINAVQGGFSRYQENAALRDTAGMDVPEWQGVGEAAFESGVMGSALGAPFGAIAGHRGKRQAEAGVNARKDASRQAMDEKAARAQQMAENSPHTKPVDPVESYRQQFSGLSRDELLQHYADADLAHENDVDAVYRKHAANGLLKEMDRADQLKGVVDEMQGKPRNEVLKEYRDLNEKDKRNETEQMRWEAARQVLKPQPKAPTEQPQPAQNTSSENTARRPLYDADNLDVPAFMRDPRFRDFTDEPTEVQQHLTRGNAPTPEELVHEQMTKGDAGPTEYEMAERPRLPPPGDIHPGQGYPLPGDVRHLPDESPAGRGGRYTTTGEVRGQSYEKGRQTVAPEGVQRQGETLQSEQEYRELPAPERQGLPRPEEPGHTSHEQGGMAAREPRDSEKNLLQKPEKAGQQQSATEKSGEKIDDFGEVIHGAVKHRRAALAESMKEEQTAEDYHTQPFSKLFPKPDYEKMAGEGTDNKTLAMLALLRNMIPAKPRVPHRLNRWAKQVEEVRDTAGQLLDGSLAADKFIDRIRKEKGSHYSEIVNTWEMLHRLSPAQLAQAAGYRVKTHAYSMFRGEQYNPPKVVHSLENEKGRSILDSEDLKDLNKKAKAYFDQQAASPEPADSKTKLDIYQNRRTGEIFIAYGKNKTSLQGGFKTVAEARDYAKTRRAELLEKLNKLREQSREEQRNASNRDRNGPVRRGGEMHTDVNALRNISGSGAGYSEKAASFKRKIAARMNTNDAFAFNRLMDSRFANERERGIAIAERVAATLEPEQNVTPEKFSDAFGFRGVQFGNYVEGPRRQSDLNRAYDSLMDMADVLKVPAKALSLNGRLGLAFGARGKGGKNAAAAHYEPGAVAINLTKGNGAGSLAHEWFHALDNYFGQYDVAKDSDVGSGGEYMTERHRKVRQRDGNTYVTIEHPVRQEVYDAFKGVMKAIKESSLPERSLRLDDVRRKPYWSTDIEMAARAFERYVQDKAKSAGVENDFLVNIRKADDHGSPDTYAYPTNEELDGGIRQAFDHLFSTLKTRETDKGVAFYSREKGNKTLRTPWQKDFPDVVLHARLGDATAHRDYEAAKGGDKDAAYRLVSEILTKDAVDKIRNIICNREVLLAAVHAEEASGRNKIPQAMADILGKVLHQEVDDSLVQTKLVGRTGQDGFGRLANQPEFAGNVRSDLPYFILDDTLTQGGTLAGLKGYIESHGGRVIGASALTGKQYSARMALSPQTLSQLREHFGGTGLENWWKQQHGYGFDGLTESEANYLLRAGDADKIRDRVLAARQTGDSPVLSEAPGDGRPLPPDVKSRFAQKASENGGFSVIGDGNLLSETGRSAKAESEGSSVRKVKTVARTVMDRIKDNDLNVRVVKSQAEAAELAGESLDKHGKVHAFYRPDEHEIVLVADNLPDGRTVREKLRHEIIHHAMENVVTPAEYKTIIDNVLKTRDSNNATIKDIWRKVDASYADESPQVQAGEFLAHMAEKHTPGKLGAAWNRVVALIKAVLRRTGLFQPSDLNDIGYVRDTIRTLGQRVRKGYVPREGGDVSYSRTGKPDPFRVPEGDGERYRRDLAKAVKSHRSSDISITIGRTPPVLRHIGAPDLPLVISRDTVRKATNGVKHDVPMDVIEQLPELMHDPEAVYQSATEKNAVVMLFDAVDKNGDPVIGAVHLKADKKGLEINKVASVYGAFPSKMSKMDREGLALYKKQNPDNQTAGVLQLHGDSDHQGSVNKILSPDDIRKGPYYSRSRSALSPEETLAARFVRRVQDKFQVLKAVQDNIRKSGGKLDDSNDAYLAEELFHGKAENDLNVMTDRYVKPLAKLLAEYDIPQSALDEYLYARHAPERNLHIAKINPKMPDGGSGMTNAEAAGIMDRVRRSGKQAQYDRLAGIVDDMLARRRELIREAGLEKDGVVDAWQNAYKHYVPLKGQDADGALPRTGRGYVVSGKESKMAMGRNSKAQSPSTQAIQDLTESLIRNRKNEVGNAFLKLVQDNPDKDYWQVFTDDKPDTTRRIVEKNDPATGETIRQVEEAPVAMALMSDKYFATKKDGKTYYIKLHDDRLAKAMKNMGPETTGTVLRAFGSINRFLSSVNTMYNPSFLVTNFGRDLQTAIMSIYGEQGRSDGLLVGKKMSALSVVRDSVIAMKAVYDSLRGTQRGGKEGEWQKLWKEFVEDGAKTGWFRINDLEGRMKEMDRLVAQAKGGWQGKSIQTWHAFFKLVEDGNNAVENALRLSAYKHGRDAGMSRQQAASLAKNLTVNFNRRGELGTVLNSLYMFANASIQGTANMIRALGRLEGNGPLLQRLRWSNFNRTQKLSLAAMGAGYLLASLNRAGAGQDDDGVNWYDKVPDYVKEHNLVIMKSLFGGKQGEYWTFPLPYGYNMFYLLGGTIEGVGSGGIKPVKVAGNIIGGALGAFNPLGSEDSETLSGTLLKNLSPTLPRPFIDYVMNENFMGTQIRRQNAPWGTPKPDSTLGRRSTPEVYKSFANWLNTTTGGSQYRSGAVDINPDSMKYWIDYISGGTGRFIGQTVDATAKTYNGIDIPAQQVPFLGKLSGQVMPYADQQNMYDRIDELSQYNAELKSLSGADRAAFRNKYSGQLSMNGITHQSQLQLKNLRKQRDEVYSDPTLTARQQADRVLMIEQNMKKVVDRFNREYREKVGN
ncbi:LPD38 domain-containing protein [Salmonella enterica subsp. diarizonae serovar 16:z10:e,n,x,z15]